MTEHPDHEIYVYLREQFPRWTVYEGDSEQRKRDQQRFLDQWPAKVREWKDLYPEGFVLRELKLAYAWEENKKNFKTPSGRNKFIADWLERSWNRGGHKVEHAVQHETGKSYKRKRYPHPSTALRHGYVITPEIRVGKLGGYLMISGKEEDQVWRYFEIKDEEEGTVVKETLILKGELVATGKLDPKGWLVIAPAGTKPEDSAGWNAHKKTFKQAVRDLRERMGWGGGRSVDRHLADELSFLRQD